MHKSSVTTDRPNNVKISYQPQMINITISACPKFPTMISSVAVFFSYKQGSF